MNVLSARNIKVRRMRRLTGDATRTRAARRAAIARKIERGLARAQ